MSTDVGAALAGVDVVVVSCNSGSLLEDCIARVLLADGCASLTLYDNASSDIWPQQVQHRFSGDARFSMIAGGRNIGFGAACNRAAANGSAPWVLLLNPDCLVESDTLPMLRALAAQDTSIGLLGADVRDAIGRDELAARRHAPTPGRLLRDQLSSSSIGNGVHIARNADALQEVDATSGALMLLPRAVFERIGGFDERYFLHGEDLDLCARVRALGLRVVVANEVRVTHRQGSSSHARPLFVAWHKHLGLGRYLFRHGTQSGIERALVALALATSFLIRGVPRALLARNRSSNV